VAGPRTSCRIHAAEVQDDSSAFNGGKARLPIRAWLVCHERRQVRKTIQKIAKAEAVLLAKFPNYYPYFGQTEEIGRFKIPGTNHRQNQAAIRSAL
jgi:hypothetical protein